MLVCRSTTSSSSLYSFLKTSDDYSLTNPNSTDEESRVSFVQLIHVRLEEESSFHWCRWNLTEKCIFLVVFKGLGRFQFIFKISCKHLKIFVLLFKRFFRSCQKLTAHFFQVKYHVAKPVLSEPFWNEKVILNNDLIYQYQMDVRDNETVLKEDMKKLSLTMQYKEVFNWN